MNKKYIVLAFILFAPFTSIYSYNWKDKTVIGLGALACGMCITRVIAHSSRYISNLMRSDTQKAAQYLTSKIQVQQNPTLANILNNPLIVLLIGSSEDVKAHEQLTYACVAAGAAATMGTGTYLVIKKIV